MGSVISPHPFAMAAGMETPLQAEAETLMLVLQVQYSCFPPFDHLWCSLAPQNGQNSLFVNGY